MSNFPFAPFLASLAEDGIPITLHDYRRVALLLKTGGPWTLDRVRDSLLALLTHDPEQQEIFLRRFEQVFQTDVFAATELADADVARILQELAMLAPAEPQQASPPLSDGASGQRATGKPAQSADVEAARSPWQQWLIIATGLVMAGLLLLMIVQPFKNSPEAEPSATPLALSTPTPVAEADAERAPDADIPQERFYEDVPIVEIVSTPAARSQAWRRYAWLSLLLALAAAGFAVYLWRSRQTPEDLPPPFSEEGVRYFPLGSIGGRPQARMADAILDELADSMGYFLSEERGEVLDVTASIRSTMARGGIPELAYRRRITLRSLLILEDGFAEAVNWNPIAQELSHGMQRRGVSVLHGRFYGSPDQIRFEQGPTARLEDIEDQRNGFVVLLFTDGTGLNRRESLFALESLGRWPFVAWLDLRDPSLWDESSKLPGQFGIPVYPASTAGVVLALRRFMTEQGAGVDFTSRAANGNGVPSYADKRFDVYLEELMGDAYGWAQDCAMFQPVSLGLADGLRRTFHENLPPERVDRLLALPGVKNNVAGLRFSDDVLRVLRRAFLIRRSEAEQVAVLEYIVARIEEAEPVDLESMAHLAWEASRERVRLEYDQDTALKRLAQLAKTPIGENISATLEGYGLPDQETLIPLRVRPDNKDAWQRLARISPEIEAPAAEAYPVRIWQWALLTALVVAALAVAGWSVYQWRQSGRTLHPVVEGETSDVFVRLERMADGEYEQVETDPWLRNIGSAPIDPSQSYRLTVYEDGYRYETELEPVWGQHPKIVVSEGDLPLPCVEPVAESGITIRADDEFLLCLPWPLLAHRGIFLCLKGWSIALSGNTSEEAVELPPSPRILVAAPKPATLVATRADEHLDQLEDLLSAHDARLTWGNHLRRVDTWRAFGQEVTDFRPEIVYYYGHATAHTGSTHLLFPGENGADLDRVPVIDFARKLRELDPAPKIVYVNCCSGDAAGFLGAGRQLEDFVPVVVTNRTVAEVSTAMAQAVVFWDDVLLRGISPQRSVAGLYSKLDDLNLRTSDVRWLTPVLHSHCNAWRASPPKAPGRLTHDPHWHLKIDRVVQYSVVAEQTRQMLRERKPRSHAFIWYGREGEGMEIFHQRLNVELRESLPQRTYLYEVRPEWPAEFHSVHRSCQDMLLEAFQVGTLDDVPGRIRAKTAGAIGMQTLVYVRHEPVRSAKVLSSSNLLAYLEWWDTQFVPLLERQQFALLGVSFEVRKPEAFLERMERLEATTFTATVVRILNQLDRLARRDLIDFLNTHSIQLPPIRREETLSRILDETDGRYDLTVEKLKNLIEMAWESEEPAAVDIVENEEEDW